MTTGAFPVGTTMSHLALAAKRRFPSAIRFEVR